MGESVQSTEGPAAEEEDIASVEVSTEEDGIEISLDGFGDDAATDAPADGFANMMKYNDESGPEQVKVCCDRSMIVHAQK
jgi:hypothetical protein